MAIDYQAPTKDMAFLIKHVVDLETVTGLPGYDECTDDVIDAVLEEASKFAHGVISPLNSTGDQHPPRLDREHNVTTSAGFKEGYTQYAEAGWNSLSGNPQFEGQGLPELLATATNEMWHSANMSFALCPMLTAGAIHAIEHHGSDSQQALFLPKMISGQWAGTMNLTEPQAGSDLAAVTTKATPEGEHFLLSGIKIYITYGEHDLTENIIHLVLGRLPDAPKGVKGISLFIVPKFLINTDGSLGERNDLKCLSLEHKLGIHGSPTAVMSYGESRGAIGYLVGRPHEGLSYMFTMMNHARLQVGLQGVSISERALQQAIWYAYDRVQGKTLIEGPAPAPIAYHPDVRRLLSSMQCRTQAMRALTYEAAAQLDIAARHPDPNVAAHAQARADLLIPVVKGWCTEQSIDIASMGIQVHGGMGYVEETGAAQHLRDARITTIYEGTTAIQANDFVGRKILRDQGKAFADLCEDMTQTSRTLTEHTDPDLQRLGAQLAEGINTLKRTVDWLLTQNSSDSSDLSAVFFGSVPLLMMAGDVTGGWMMARSALACDQPATTIEPTFAKSKKSAALLYADMVLLPGLGRAHLIEHGQRSVDNALCL